MPTEQSDYIHLAGHAIGPGEDDLINLNIARLPSRTVIDIPIYVSRAEKPGPVLLLMAGLHGDEINGMEILRRMMSENLHKPIIGTVITIPVLNIYGFLNYSRELPDGKDINRSFPGSRSGSLASRVAWHVTNDILPLIDYGLDFHTGGASRSNVPQIRAVLDKPINNELAHVFKPRFIMNAPLRDKSLRREAARNGKSIMVYEGGQSLLFDEHVIVEGIAGARRVMHHLGMIKKAPPAPKYNTVILDRSSWVRAKAAGLFHHSVENGQPVKKGQTIGMITDPFGEFEVPVKSQVNGFMIGLNYNPVVNQGDALAHLGVE